MTNRVSALPSFRDARAEPDAGFPLVHFFVVRLLGFVLRTVNSGVTDQLAEV
jgi:hypothetical protein